MSKRKNGFTVLSVSVGGVNKLNPKEAGIIAKQLRLGAGLTQASLAKKLECTQARVSQMETGDISESNLVSIAEACGYTTTFYFARKTAGSS